MVPRNAKCPCGSGKQYKRCCINKPNKSAIKDDSAGAGGQEDHKGARKSKFSFCNRYSPGDLFPLLSLLQLQPQNHGKNIRLETAVIEAVNAIGIGSEALDNDAVWKELIKELPKDYREDPPANFFTENIVFSTGNNVVYPGIFIDTVEMLQLHINGLFSGARFSENFVKECSAALVLLLNIQRQIASNLGHTHRIYQEIESEDLYVPDTYYYHQHKDVCSFSFQDIQEICDRYEIPYKTLDPFVFCWQNGRIASVDPDNNPLIKQPFIFWQDRFYLVMPTAVVNSLIQFIIERAVLHDMRTAVEKQFAKGTVVELQPLFIRMNWEPLSFTFPDPGKIPEYLLLNEMIWKVDVNRFAYVIILTERILSDAVKESNQKDFSRYLQKRISKMMTSFKESIETEEILLLTIVSKIGLVSFTAFDVVRINSVNYFLSLTPVELEVLINNWKFDHLTLWKYVKYLTHAEKKLRFAPMTSQLAIFDYYKHNKESFFHSDERNYTHILLDFAMEGNVRRKGLAKVDKIGIIYGDRKSAGFLQSIRKEEHYPVYISQEIYYGIARSCLLRYSCPIWLEAERNDRQPESYINAILYWLNEIHEDAAMLVDQLGKIPLRIVVSMHEDYERLEELEDLNVFDDAAYDIPYKIDVFNRKIFFTIPVEMVQFFFSATNAGERILIDFLLDIIGKLVTEIGGVALTDAERRWLLDKHIPESPRKMLLLFNGEKDIRLNDVDIPRKRYIPDADVSFILENQVEWLFGKVPEKLELHTVYAKTEFLNKLVGMHYEKLMASISNLDREKLLIALMRRNESLLQSRSFRRVSYPARQLCYSHFYDVQKVFSDSEGELVETNLAIRILIEFVLVAEATGTKEAAEDVIDLLLAATTELVNYGAISDAILFQVEDVEINLLPSGRIGLMRNEKTSMQEFRDNVYAEEMYSYSEEFHKHFKRRIHDNVQSDEQKRYTEKLNAAFREEWGITLGEIDLISYSVCSMLLAQKQSVKLMPAAEFIPWILRVTDLEEPTVRAFLNRMIFPERVSPLQAPEGFEGWEVRPWRFNRRLSYMHRPILSLMKDEKEYYLLSARHLLTASENLMSLFFNGTLKVDKDNKKVGQLLAERNKIKGEEYREEVLQWLKLNTSLEVYDYEAKIRPRGFFKSETDKGDIDILAIDREKNIVYSLECKNTVQSKMSYDFKREIDMYLGIGDKQGLIEKHVKRHKWLEENRQQVQEKLALTETPVIISIVISKNILTLQHLKTPPLPIVSFYELRSGRFTF